MKESNVLIDRDALAGVPNGRSRTSRLYSRQDENQKQNLAILF